jgi:hypothetical protein
MLNATHTSKKDKFVWWPIAGAAMTAAVFIPLETFLDFVPIGDPRLGGLRNVLEILEVIGVLGVVFIGGLIFVVLGVVLLFTRQWPTLISWLIAPIAFVALVLALKSLWLLDPYYWFVVTQQDRLLTAARASRHPPIMIVDSRDVSKGLVTTPSTVTTILYDPSDSLLDRSRDPEWKTLKHDVFNDDLAWIGAVHHLHGHFYIVWGSWG